MSKKISKKKLDSVIELSRMYWRDGNCALLNGISAICNEIAGDDFLFGMALNAFIGSIVKTNGICPEADNETIYNAFQLFGWDIVRDVV